MYTGYTEGSAPNRTQTLEAFVDDVNVISGGGDSSDDCDSRSRGDGGSSSSLSSPLHPPLAPSSLSKPKASDSLSDVLDIINNSSNALDGLVSAPLHLSGISLKTLGVQLREAAKLGDSLGLFALLARWRNHPILSEVSYNIIVAILFFF